MTDGDRNPYEAPSAAGVSVVADAGTGSSLNAAAIVVAAFLIATAILTISWPANWAIHMPLAALFGPWLACWLGREMSVFGFAGLFVFAGLSAPYCFKRSPVRIALLFGAFAWWASVGAFTGLLLWA